MRYPSKIDPWLGALVLVGPITVSIAALLLHVAAVWFAALAVLGITLLLIWPCNYTLDTDQLVVRCGVVKIRVAYREIESISPSRSALSSPALSMDRVAIVFCGKTMYVSPVMKEKFMTELQARVNLARG